MDGTFLHVYGLYKQQFPVYFRFIEIFRLGVPVVVVWPCILISIWYLRLTLLWSCKEFVIVWIIIGHPVWNLVAHWAF